jgi:hypothetical protein
MLYVSVAPALVVGFQLENNTRKVIDLTQVLSSTALCSMIFAVTVAVKGRVIIFTSTIYDLSQEFKIHFLPWYCVIGFIGCFIPILLAILNVSLFVK